MVPVPDKDKQFHKREIKAMDKSHRGSTLSNLLWRFLERFGAQLVTFVLSIVLARILDPELFGKVALITVFITILQVIADSGLGSALIQKKDADDLDFSSVFIFNLVFSVVAFTVMFFAAPVLDLIFDMGDIVWPVRVLSIVLILSGVKNVQIAHITRQMKFKLFFFSTLGGTIVSAAVGIMLALNGYGIWALVMQMVVNNGIDMIILWILSGFRPKLRFDPGRLKVLYSYGWKLLLSSLLDNIYNEFVKLFVGLKFAESSLAFYNQGAKVPEFIFSNFNSAMDGVLFPSLAKSQSDKDTVKRMARRSLKTGMYIMLPIMTGLAVCAGPLVTVFLTEKWLPAVIYMRLFCIAFAFYPVHTANLNVMKALGRSELILVLELIKKGLGIVLLILALMISPVAVAVSAVIDSVLCIFVNASPNRNLIDYGFLSQLKDIIPYILLSAVMGGTVYLAGLIPVTDGIKLLIQIPAGIIVYIGLSEVLHIECYNYLKSAIKELFAHGKN